LLSAFSSISTTLTVTNPQSDHLMGSGKKRPALLGEVSGGRALATTRLYPALFSTQGRYKGNAYCDRMAIVGHLRTKPPQSVLLGLAGNYAAYR